ncbi:hypothetical protein FISHEDRAFT_11234, partial [Fistulina hepatica ATCC 64428]
LNTVNAATGLSGFQIRFGRAPCVLPPTVLVLQPNEAVPAKQIVEDIISLENEAKDSLFTAKVSQAHYANVHRSADEPFAVGDKVLLSTLHRRREYKSKNDRRVAK